MKPWFDLLWEHSHLDSFNIFRIPGSYLCPGVKTELFQISSLQSGSIFFKRFLDEDSNSQTLKYLSEQVRTLYSTLFKLNESFSYLRWNSWSRELSWQRFCNQRLISYCNTTKARCSSVNCGLAAILLQFWSVDGESVNWDIVWFVSCLPQLLSILICKQTEPGVTNNFLLGLSVETLNRYFTDWLQFLYKLREVP